MSDDTSGEEAEKGRGTADRAERREGRRSFSTGNPHKRKSSFDIGNGMRTSQQHILRALWEGSGRAAPAPCYSTAALCCTVSRSRNAPALPEEPVKLLKPGFTGSSALR